MIPEEAFREATGFGKTKVVQILNSLVAAGYIQKIGNGRGTKWIVVQCDKDGILSIAKHNRAGRVMQMWM